MGLETLTPLAARDLMRSTDGLQDWLAQHGDGRPLGAMVGAIAALAQEAQIPRRANRHRSDAEALGEFVQRAGRLPLRLRQVARLCLQDGATIDECATSLGISRVTVRSHLRRLRQLHATHCRRLAMSMTNR